MEVKIWQEVVVIPSYEAGVADKNPMFFEKRVYQGSSGVVYPNPVIESVSDEKADKEYIALFLENRYLRIMVLPELGGRVQMAYDKIAQRHFIYYNQVIKPALVGLCGPWISGGIEFNWPQHHRPSTFDPVDFLLEQNSDGSSTVWVNEVEKMFRTKGMAGFTLHPDKAYLEIKVKLSNRTSLPQTFLWWANPAVSAGEHYQSVFPPDVHAVFDHGKRDVSAFPIARGTYYKVDYAPGTDISRYKNIPVPTSYMAVNSEYNFVGGYEHDTEAGVLHVADHHVSPGKKQWTWGNGDFGLAWDRNLTDGDGPYIELMTGVYTDNQPDFSWLMPYEEKTFTQYFLPYRKVGLVKNASKDLLLGLDSCEKLIVVRVFATSDICQVKVILREGGRVILEKVTDLSPERMFEEEIVMENDFDRDALILRILSADGRELLSYQTRNRDNDAVPEAAKAALAPGEIDTAEELFLTGQHLEQYRHATYDPVSYYREALKRDAGDLRSNNALGKWYLRRGRFELSLPFFRTAIARAIARNPNPYDSEPYYNLGLALCFAGDLEGAYNAFFKACWSSAWQDSAYFSVAKIDVIRGDYERGLEHINWAIDKNARNGKAYVVKAHLLRKMSHLQEAIAVLHLALDRDKFNLAALYELHLCYYESGRNAESAERLQELVRLSRRSSHSLIEYAIDFADFGAYKEALAVLDEALKGQPANPMVYYYSAYYRYKLGDVKEAMNWFESAARQPSDYCFPNRLEDIIVLEQAMQLNPSDGKASYYLGNLWYDKRQYDLATVCWEKARYEDPLFATSYRNLAIAAFNKEHDKLKAVKYFEQAYLLNVKDARVLMELDQLYKRLNYSPEERLASLEARWDVVKTRDDLYLELVALYNFRGEYERAFDQLMRRKFHPWEGGEGKVSWQYVYSLAELAKADLRHGKYEDALEKLEQAQVYPHNLGEGKLPGAQENDIFYWIGCAYEGLGRTDQARAYWRKATVGLSEPAAGMFYNDQQPDKIFYQGLAWEKLGEPAKAADIFRGLLQYGEQHMDDEVKIDYFAVSLPDLLIFEADLKTRNSVHCLYIAGLGLLGLKEPEAGKAYLSRAMEADKMHFGARTHLDMVKS